MVSLVCREVVKRKKLVNILVMLENDAAIISATHFANDEKAADIFFCQERKTMPETRNTILVPRTRSIIDKTAFGFKVILPSYLDKLLLIASPFSGLFK